LGADVQASPRTVTLQKGDSLSTLARRYDVSVSDIARANRITPTTVLRDGRSLVIPDPPKRVQKPGVFSKAARVLGDRVAVRLGPHENYRRLSLLDNGVPVLLNRRSGDWYQVQLPSREVGWIRGDFVSVAGDKPQVAGVAGPKTSPEARRALAQAQAESRKRKRLASAESSRRSVRRSSTRIASLRRRRSSRPEPGLPDVETNVVRTAMAYRGTPYRYGASGGRGFDCSGFTSHVYRKQGVSLPHSSRGQFSKGQRVGKESLEEGDLVFFSTTRRGISHVGIYAGQGKFVHASSGGGRVRVDSLNEGYYKNRYRGARRVSK
jgi:peptidoglycan endopeptidase LytF